MSCFTAYSLISDVSGTMRQCNLEGNHVNGCLTHDIELSASGHKKLTSLAGQNRLCACSEDLCNSSPWLDMTKPDQHDVIWHGRATNTDSEGVPLIEKSMPTQSMENHTFTVSYNDNSTDKIQYNGVKALNDGMMLATLLTLLFNIF